MTLRERILAANQATFEAWNRHDADAVAAIFAPDAEVIDVAAGSVLRGRDAIRADAAAKLAAFPDFRLERLMLLVDSARNADQWRMTGTHRGAWVGLAPTGRRIEVRGASFSEFDADGLVIRDTHHIDLRALLAQLGLAG